jgi:phosphatidylethanolamine-binding protein (PEBP) family uncharacterized protein
MLSSMTLVLSSPAFEDGAAIPERFDHDSGDISPALAWDGVPAGTAELVLLVDDPDGPTDGNFVHWVLYGLSASRTGLEEAEVAQEGRSGANGFGQPGYLARHHPSGTVSTTTCSDSSPSTSPSP